MQPGVPQQPFVPPAQPPKSNTLKVVAIVVGVLVGGMCILSILAAIAIPAMVRYLRRAKETEAISKIALLCTSTRSFVESSGVLPTSSARTPSTVPAGARVIDPPGTWSGGAWTALSFSIPEPHYYSYELITEGTTFRIRAYGDLDGNGTLSTFERGGEQTAAGASCGEMRISHGEE